MTKLVKQSKKGFTLVELVVVIAILAILAAIAIPVISNTITSSKKSGAASDAQTLELAIKEAQAQIIAGDKSVFKNNLANTKVQDVAKQKSLNFKNQVEIGSETYDLYWTADEKCLYLDSAKKTIKDGTAVTGNVKKLSGTSVDACTDTLKSLADVKTSSGS